jgi:hypothetical protein
MTACLAYVFHPVTDVLKTYGSIQSNSIYPSHPLLLVFGLYPKVNNHGIILLNHAQVSLETLYIVSTHHHLHMVYPWMIFILN